MWEGRWQQEWLVSFCVWERFAWWSLPYKRELSRCVGGALVVGEVIYYGVWYFVCLVGDSLSL